MFRFSWAFAFALAGCVTANPPLRMSTAQLMQPGQSELTVATPQAQTVEKLKKLMAERGLGVKTVVATKDGKATYYVFSGPRKVIGTETTVASVGSWVAARVETHPDGTFVRLLGKPTVAGVELCSDADAQLADADYWCQDTRVNPDSPYAANLTGREEVELVRSVVLELK